MTERPAPAPLPTADDEGPTFAAPWQARAFGIAMALHRDEGTLDWAAFQSRLIDEVAAADAEGGELAGGKEADVSDPARIDARYYEQWLAALERLLVEDGLLDADEIGERAADFAAGDRTAEEFVEGDREH